VLLAVAGLALVDTVIVLQRLPQKLQGAGHPLLPEYLLRQVLQLPHYHLEPAIRHLLRWHFRKLTIY
jgi:hypothetical protein